jgi:hypothetical protein
VFWLSEAYAHDFKMISYTFQNVENPTKNIGAKKTGHGDILISFRTQKKC